MSYVICYFVLVFSVLLASRLPGLGERANLCAFRTLVVALVCFCLFPLPLDVWEGLRFVIEALPGLFYYPFFFLILSTFSGTVPSKE